MAIYDSAYLLALFNRKAGRPTADSITDASKYERLTESQNRVVAMLSAVAPQSLYPKVAYGSMPTLTTTDRQVFTFGNDSNGYPIAPMGKTGIYPSLSAIPDAPWREGIDYLNEGTQIRIPNNRSYGGTLYWRGITPPPNIDATHQPSLFPEASRELIVMDAVRQFASEYARNPDVVTMMANEWDGDGIRPGAWATWCLVWKTQFRQGGALGAYTGRDLALSSQWNYPI